MNPNPGDDSANVQINTTSMLKANPIICIDTFLASLDLGNYTTSNKRKIDQLDGQAETNDPNSNVQCKNKYKFTRYYY